ncbi:BQ2448_1890 [Microbotryum intermedium]|uniref:BQ2448_1890 protein n=1 Tax=Microbotryum intermedium TaxID=269621 RepID=A0A238FHI4_9BASI|nr:BQ2448_1890 [Microbotryum intermedium]
MQAEAARRPVFVPDFINTLRHAEERRFATEWHELEQRVLHLHPDDDDGSDDDHPLQPLHDARSTAAQRSDPVPANVATTARSPSSSPPAAAPPPAKRRRTERSVRAELGDPHQSVSATGQLDQASTGKPQLPPVPKPSRPSDEASAATNCVPANAETNNMSPPKRSSRQIAAEASTGQRLLAPKVSAVPLAHNKTASHLRRKDRPHQPLPPPPPAPRPTRAPSLVPAPEPEPKKKEVKAKPRPSLEQAHANALTISDHQKLAKQFPTITHYINYLEEHELMKPGDQPLLGCRIAFVNPYPPSGSSSKGLRNRIDMQLRMWIGRVRIQGATLVRPEHFVPSPPDAPLIESEEAKALAASQGWTTHVIPLYLTGRGEVTFQSVLAMLGQSGVAIEELGPVVKVVSNDWIEQSIKAGRPLPYWDRFHAGDTRPLAWSDSGTMFPLRRGESEIVVRPRRGKGRVGPDQTEEIEDVDEGLDTGGRGSNRTHDKDQGVADQLLRAISPLNESDFPAGDVSLNTSDPIVAADLTIRGSPRPDSPRALLVAAKKADRRK